ncbi:hypothetical protein [Sulfitobacter pacificus]|uniref:hypothetical protein n=1 Tax=Sulfitobacter pacificus TaxID=1499314 RepID=UPI0031080BEC
MDTRDIMKLAATAQAMMQQPYFSYTPRNDGPSKPKPPTNRDKIKAARKQRRKAKRK